MVPLRRRLGPTQSPVVSATISKRQNEARAASSLTWACTSCCAALLLGLDLRLLDTVITATSSLTMEMMLIISVREQFHILSYLSGIVHPALKYTELALLTLALIIAVYDATFSLNMLLTQRKIKLTPAQKKLLGVKSSTQGFDTVTTPTPFGSQVQASPATPFSRTPPLQYLTPTGSAPSSAYSTPQSVSFANSHTPTPSSFHGRPSSANKASPFSSDRISDPYSLERYLRSEEEQDLYLMRGSPDLAAPQVQPYHYGRQGPDHTPVLRKYHVATRSQSPATQGVDGDSPLCREADTVLSRLGVKREELQCWTEKCRKWLAQTVVGPVAQEIETINEVLCKIGSSEFQIGSAGLGLLRQVGKSKVQHVPTLGMVIPYLELSSKQEYLVHRIKELAKGGYLSAYRWNSGGTWKGRSWDQDLPNDSQVVMHLLCTYLDSHMPPNPRFADGRNFSSQHFLKCPDKPSAKKSNVCIYQACANPPQYKILVKESCIDVPKGRNNLFHVIVMFLHHIKTEENSMLGQINLELSGMNILWIISDE